ncbi:MAG: hypothetical protein HFF22_07845 [Oscillospiraceae bacterium]|jgi:adenylate cyclase|nr:hypothetical protein [Oscillospiraceae bacterium]
MQSGFTEIERKFLIDTFPDDLPLLHTQRVFQAYLSLEPEVRLRRAEQDGQVTARSLTIKSGSGLVRREVRIDLSREQFDALAELIPQPFISKDYRVYRLPGGLELECSLVDEGTDTAFLYAEIEFPSVEAAKAFPPLPLFKQEVTENPAYRMNRYWRDTRG